MRVALVRCVNLPEPDFDEAPGLAAFRAAGHEAEAVGWDDPAVDWSSFDMAILRATWDYPMAFSAFDEWLGRVSQQTKLLNPVEVVRWNANKRYLLELERDGVPVVPTAFVERGRVCDASRISVDRGWREVVVKPAIGAGSWRTKRFGADEMEEATEFARALAVDGDVLVQEARSEFEQPGERSIVCIGGEVSHVIAKRPRFADEEESVELGSEVSGAEESLVRTLLARFDDHLLYARVDVIPTEGGPMLSELELIEPSMYFPYIKGAADRFARAAERF